MIPLAASQLRSFLEQLEGSPGLLERTGIPYVFRVRGKRSGPRVLVMGGVHGNERGGWQAVAELLRQASTGQLSVVSGELFLAIANLPAIEGEVRYLEKNLNRLFRKDLSPDGTVHEEARAQELAPLLQSAEHMLDLHATTAPSPPFLMCERHLIDDARRIGVDRVVVGWAALGSASVAGDTESFSLSCGNRAFTMENGQWCWEGSFQCAYEVALKFLRHTGTISGSVECISQQRVYELFHVQNKLREGFQYATQWKTFDSAPAGTIVGFDGVEEFRAPEDCFVIMPGDANKIRVNEDLYLLARLLA